MHLIINSFLVSLSCLHGLFLFFFFIYRTELISGIGKCKVVKRNHKKKAQRQPSNSKNLIA